MRAFLPDPVPRDVIERILDIAARAPSGTNMQPWKAYALAGEHKDRLSRALLAAHDSGAPAGGAEYHYYPAEFFEPYLGRRRKIGWDMYGLLGIARGEAQKMRAQLGRNYVFFDAPVGVMFTIDRRLEIGSWLDYGMFLQNILIAARAFGLEACPQAAFAPHQAIVRESLAIPENEIVVCGVAIGREDTSAPVNTLVTEREPAAAFTEFRGFS